MIGKEYPSEITRFADSKTGREITKLTSAYDNYHLYFTDNSFTLGDKEIYFLSTRPYNIEGVYNLCKMDLDTGRITLLTDEKTGINTQTKTPDSSILVYAVGSKYKKLDTATGKIETIYEGAGDFVLGHPFISPDKKHVGTVFNENVNIERGKNYSGFKERLFAAKKGIVSLIAMDGSGHRDVFEDTHQLGHFQFAPDDNNLAMFCHEGPWNLVHQRIWILDLATGKPIPCFRQGEDDSVGHEFWTRDGYIFFDNRRKGHDGTITSDKTQATIATPAAEAGQMPYIGLANRKGHVISTIDMPHYCNHYHANNDNTLLVGDDVEDLVLVDISGDKAKLSVLCHHGTSWYGQKTHCHPTFSWDSSKILYASDINDCCHVYCVDV